MCHRHSAGRHPQRPTAGDRLAPRADALATASTLQCAEQLGVKSLGIPSFGTGAGGLQGQEAEVAQIEVEEVHKHLDAGSNLDHIVFAVIDAAAYKAFEQALA